MKPDLINSFYIFTFLFALYFHLFLNCFLQNCQVNPAPLKKTLRILLNENIWDFRPDEHVWSKVSYTCIGRQGCCIYNRFTSFLYTPVSCIIMMITLLLLNYWMCCNNLNQNHVTTVIIFIISSQPIIQSNRGWRSLPP